MIDPVEIAIERSPRIRALGAFEAYGLELEYMLVARDSLDVRPIADEALELAGAPPGSGELERGVLGWSNELVCHVIELKNVVPGHLAELVARFQAEVSAFNRLLGTRNVCLMPGGMHPWMDPAAETRLWPHGSAAVYETYDRIFNCRSHGWANVQSTHVNLPFRDDEEFERLHAAVRVVLPLIPALAASSPYAAGRTAGALDYRMEVYRHNSATVPTLTGDVIPETVASRAEYERRLLRPMYRDIAPHDPAGILQHEWLNSRGAIARFSRNAIEIRVMDVQECPLADVAIAAAIVDVVRALYEERLAPFARQQQVPGDVLAEIFVACVRDAERAMVAQPEYLRLFGIPRDQYDAGALWWRIAERVGATGATHRELWAAPMDLILTRGPLARRLFDALGATPTRGDMRDTYRELCASLAAGRMFDP